MKEEHTQHHHHQYEGGGMADLRQFFSTAPIHYDVSMMLANGGTLQTTSSGVPNASIFTSSPPTTAASGFADVEAGATARWPRQETLTLLEIRSRLHHKFKEANHKGPLWDELSRIMCEEHGYQRSGKKCREKFENLYKYYKKTKDGKSGRHDGKHYRFFRQLEALYGEPANTNTATTTATAHLRMMHANNMIGNNTVQVPTTEARQCNTISMSLSNYSSSDFNTSSSEGSKRSWKEKMKEFIDTQMRKIMEKQEAWLETMVRTIEHKEQQRMCREEEWRKQESQRMEREHKFWANERAWIEARDKALIETLHRVITSKEVFGLEKNLSSNDHAQEQEESNGCINEDYCNKKRKVNLRSNDQFHNNFYKYGEMNSIHGGNPVNESCLRMLLGDGGETHLWDQSYALKLNKGETH